MDPDEREIHRQLTVTARQQLAQIEQVKQSVQPFIQAAKSGAFVLSPEAGQALLNAIHHCRDGLVDIAGRHVDRISQNTKLGTSPDALVMTTFNKEIADGGTNSAMIALGGLDEILAQAEEGVTAAMRRYRQMDGNGAHDIRRAGA
jgi:hypothetical protein